MSFLVRGDEGPTNIPVGKAGGIFQAIARAGLEAGGEGSFERTGRRRRRRGSKNRMAGQADSLRRFIERGLQSGGGEGFLPKPQATTTMPREKGIPSKPKRMTKEEFDKIPRKRTRLAPGMEDLIDRFPTQGDEGKPRRSRSRRRTSRGSKSRDEMRDPNARPTVYNRGEGSKRRSRDEMRDPNARPTVRSENIL